MWFTSLGLTSRRGTVSDWDGSPPLSGTLFLTGREAVAQPPVFIPPGVIAAPVRKDVALAQALAVIVEAETVLLRSAENPGERAAQFQRIASAVGSNKVLLRSL